MSKNALPGVYLYGRKNCIVSRNQISHCFECS
ncbi:hypothetical protein [Hungatella effluvii]